MHMQQRQKPTLVFSTAVDIPRVARDPKIRARLVEQRQVSARRLRQEAKWEQAQDWVNGAWVK